jgi:uncharacterized cupin superfamily protein
MAAPLRIVSFAAPVETSSSTQPPDRLLAGQPRQTVANHYADASNQFFAGIWSSTRGKWRVSYTEHELCHLLAGRVVIESEAGERTEFAAGDSFVVPAGFSGTWEVIEDCRKVYAIFEPASS